MRGRGLQGAGGGSAWRAQRGQQELPPPEATGEEMPEGQTQGPPQGQGRLREKTQEASPQGTSPKSPEGWPMNRRISRIGLLLAIAAAFAIQSAPAAAAPQWLLESHTNTAAVPGGEIDYNL